MSFVRCSFVPPSPKVLSGTVVLKGCSAAKAEATRFAGASAMGAVRSASETSAAEQVSEARARGIWNPQSKAARAADGLRLASAAARNERSAQADVGEAGVVGNRLVRTGDTVKW